MLKCQAKTEVWSRVCGFFRPVAQWNRGKKSEYRERLNFAVPETADRSPKAED